MISIIVPVYNSEKYIRECIDSILVQGNKDFEVILVDDGSTDESSKICDKYSNEYENIRVIHQENNGVSSARQKGIDISNGDWIMFVDSDDLVEENMFKTLNNNLCDSDIIIFDKRFEKREFFNGSKDNLIEGILGYETKDNLHNKSLFSVWSKLYNKKFLLKNRIIFEKEIFNGEDMLFNIDAVNKSKKILFVNESFYYYRENFDSITHLYNEKILVNDKRFLEKLYLQFKDLSDGEEDKTYNEIVLNGLFICMRRYFSHKNNNKNMKQKKIELYNFISQKPYSIALNKMEFSIENLTNPKKLILLMLKYRFILLALIVCKIK